jgi:hypothetical protein
VWLCGLAEHLTGIRVEGGVQQQRAMAKVFKAMPLGSPWRQRQHGIFAIKRLDGRLCIQAEHGRMCRRV